MTFTQLSLYGFSAVLVVAALMVITVRNPVKAALFLVLAFFSAACVWITLEAEFLAIVLVLVYVGAVMVLFLFVVMMLDIDLAVLREGFTRYLPVATVIAVLMVIEMVIILTDGEFSAEQMPRPDAAAADYSNTRELGKLLYTQYVLPFEIAAMILLLAIVAAISLTMRRRPDTKYQKPSKQVQVRRQDRVRLVEMEAEKKDPDQ